MKEKIIYGSYGVLIGCLLSSVLIVGVYFSTFHFPKSESKEFKEFQLKHGTKQIFFCNEDEFLVEKFFDRIDDTTPTLRLIKNGGDSPVHCVYFNKKKKD